MNIWKRLKNLWKWSEFTPANKDTKVSKKNIEEMMNQITSGLPKRPATIVEDELPDNLENND